MDLGIVVMLYKESGEIYSTDEWTNENLKLRIYYKDDNSREDKYFYLNGIKTKYTKDYVITDNCVIKVEHLGKEVEVKVTKIDKDAPTVELSQNGGAKYVMPTKGKAIIRTSLRAEDGEGSGLKELKYAWSTSNKEEPSIWEEFINGETLSKNDCEENTYYLWTKVIDNVGNRAENVKVSEGFVIRKSDITIKTNINEWTNKDVTVTAKYGENLTQNRKMTCTGINKIDYEINGITNAIVKTNNNTVTVTAEDIAGNKIEKTVTIDKIDKLKPNTFIPTSTATTIVLLENTSESIIIPNGKNITLNLNNKTITSTETTIQNLGTLTLQGGTVNSTSNYISLQNEGTLNFESGTVVGNSWSLYNKQSGIFNMIGGEIIYTGTGNGSAIMNEENFNMSGGTIDSQEHGLVSRGGTSTVSGGIIESKSSSHWAVLTDTKGLANIYNTTIKGTNSVYNSLDNEEGKTRIFDCSINGKVYGRVTEVVRTSTGYLVYWYDAYTEATTVTFPTWTNNNGQDDLAWHNGISTTRHGTKVWYYSVNKSEHKNETGLYFTHIYINGTFYDGFSYSVK